MQRLNQPHIRPVRSYCKRQGRISPRQERALEELWPDFGLELNDKYLDFASAFGRSGPTILEIGFGMGASLLECAKRDPMTNFIGIEVHLPGVGALLADMRDQNVTNIRVYKQDAIEVITSCIPDKSLDKVLILFPDPWPKKRHHKRRLIQKDFLLTLYPKLKTGGFLHLATDWQPYADHMLEVLTELSGFQNVAGSGYADGATLRPPTKFEKRGQNLGHPIRDLLFQVC